MKKYIYIPSNLDLPQLLGDLPENELHKYYYLIHLIYEQKILYNKDEYVSLKSLYLRRIINDDFELYRDRLIYFKVIDCDFKYIKNKKSYGYKLLPPYSEVKHIEIELKNANIIRNIEKWKSRRLPTTDVHLHLYHFLNKIEINYQEALSEIENLPVQEYNPAKITIDKFKNKDFYLYSDDYGRVHTNITCLKSTLRKFLFYQNKMLKNIDLINSQPFFLLPLLLIPSIRCAVQYISEVSEKSENDILKYKNLVEQGRLYGYVMEETGETDRDVFKETFFRDVFFGKGVSKDFKKLFPNVAKKLLEIKKGDYRKLAWNMQRVESDFIINQICRKIMEEHPNTFISTIHDSILTTEDQVDVVIKVMKDVFAENKLHPAIRVD